MHLCYFVRLHVDKKLYSISDISYSETENGVRTVYLLLERCGDPPRFVTISLTMDCLDDESEDCIDEVHSAPYLKTIWSRTEAVGA